MTWVKICGLRTVEDVVAAEEAGADAVGFVVAPSIRRLEIEQAGALVERTNVLAVLVTVDLRDTDVPDLVARTGAGALQPHGSHQAGVVAAAHRAGVQVLLPIPVSRALDWTTVPEGVTPLLDAEHPGSGEPFDWSVVPRARRRFILAGGLTPATVVAAVTATGAWGVDVSSGVESEPGHKDPALIRRFVERAKSA